jgi:hypothetical protein
MRRSFARAPVRLSRGAHLSVVRESVEARKRKGLTVVAWFEESRDVAAQHKIVRSARDGQRAESGGQPRMHALCIRRPQGDTHITEALAGSAIHLAFVA